MACDRVWHEARRDRVVSGLLSALLAGAAVAVLLAPRGPHRLTAVLPEASAAARVRATRRAVGPSGACALAGFGLAVLLGGPAGVVGGLLVALLGPRGLAGLEGRADRADREQVAAELPAALDLLAACLLGGAPLPGAVRAVSSALPGPTGARLGAVAAALTVGSPPEQAWIALLDPTDRARPGSGPVADRPGGELTGAVVRVMVRADVGGAPVAAQVARLADEARGVTLAHRRRAAARAGVLAVGPLGLCFLPAFVLIGIVPVVAGLVGPVLSGL